MRRTPAILSICVMAVGAVTGCTAHATSTSNTISTPATTGEPTEHELRDMAIVSSDGRIATVRDGAISTEVDGLVAADGSTLITTTQSADREATTLRWSRLGDDTVQSTIVLPGDLTAVATDSTADVVALTGPSTGTPRTGTEIVVAGRRGELFRRTYDTELLPEGFATVDSRSNLPAPMFVVEYLDDRPSTTDQPRVYRVRVLDASTGELSMPLNLRDKSQLVDEQMLGLGRTHVLSPGNGLLFTLYRGIDEAGAGYGFVHTLGFVNGVWCLDLPPEMDLGAVPGALVLADAERRMLVASANGYMTEFVVADITDPNSDPLPRRTTHVWDPFDRTATPAVASRDDTILVGQGGDLRWVDAESLTVQAALPARDAGPHLRIDAVALTADGNAVAAGSGGVVEITRTGTTIAQLTLPEGFTAARILLLDPE